MKKKEVENNEDVLNEIDQFLASEKQEKKTKKKNKEEKVILEEKIRDNSEESKKENKTKMREKKVKKSKKINDKTESKSVDEMNLNEGIEEKKDVKSEEKKETKKKSVNKTTEIDVDKVQAIEEMFDDDLYITRAFKPVKTKTKVKRGIVKFLIWTTILTIVGLCVFTLADSFIENKNKTKPINIIKHVVKVSSDTAINYLDNMDDSYGSTYEFSVDTNMKKYEILDNQKFGFSFYNKNNYVMEYIYLDSGYGIYNVKKDNDSFIKYSSSNKLIKTDETNSSLRDLFLMGNKKEDLKYIIDKNNKIFNKIVEEKYFQVSNQVITINNKEVDVIENSFAIDKYIKRELIKDYISEVKKDKEIIKAYSSLLNVDEENIVNVLENKLNKIKSDNIVFNVYTDKKFNLVGIDLEIDGFTDAYVYKYDDKYDVQFNVFKYLDNIMNEFGLDVKTDTNLGFNGNKNDTIFSINKNIKSNLKINQLDKNSFSIEYMGVNGKYFNIEISVKSNSMALNLEDYDVLISNSKIKKEINNFYNLLDDNEKNLIDYLIDIYY